MSVLGKILGYTRRDQIRNADILKDLALDMDVVERLRIRRRTYFGHCTRMDPSRGGPTRSRGRPKKRWLDNVNEDCAALYITH